MRVTFPVMERRRSSGCVGRRGCPEGGEVEWIGPEADGRRDLKKEATTVEHMLFHFPKNPYCRVCQEALMQRKPNRRRKDLPEQYKEFGDMITMDHIDANDLRKNGLHGEKDMLIVFDLATAWIAAYPVMNKTVGVSCPLWSTSWGTIRPRRFTPTRLQSYWPGSSSFQGRPSFTERVFQGFRRRTGLPRAVSSR